MYKAHSIKPIDVIIILDFFNVFIRLGKYFIIKFFISISIDVSGSFPSIDNANIRNNTPVIIVGNPVHKYPDFDLFTVNINSAIIATAINI